MAFVITEGDNYQPPQGMKRGLIERDYNACPLGYNARVFDLPLIPQVEWAGRLRDQIQSQSQVHHIRNTGLQGRPIPSGDQNGQGYCWAYSTGSALTLTRAKQGEPYVELSPHAVAWVIKGGRDRGGWGSESLEFVAENGMPSSEFWPLRSMDGRRYNTDEMRQNARKYRVTEWMDIPPRSKAHLVTCLLLGIPVVSDFNWWGHSVCTMSLLSLNPFRTLIWNSWGDRWGDNGAGILEGNKAIPDGMICPRVAIGG